MSQSTLAGAGILVFFVLATLAGVPGSTVADAESFSADKTTAAVDETVTLTAASPGGYDVKFAINLNCDAEITQNEIIGIRTAASPGDTVSLSFQPEDMGITLGGEYEVFVFEEADSNGVDTDAKAGVYPLEAEVGTTYGFDDSLSLTVTSSATATPVATVNSPTSASPVFVTSSDPVDVDYDATPVCSPTTLTLTDGSSVSFDDLTTGTDQTYTVPAGSLSSGAYDLALTTTSSSGATDTATEPDAVIIDNTDPTISDVTASNQAGSGTVSEGDTVTVVATVSDVYLDTVTVDASALGGSSALELSNTGYNTFEGTFTVSNPSASDGGVLLEATATDLAGNQDQLWGYVTLDTTAPDVSNVVVENTDGSDAVTTGDEVTVSATVTDVTATTAVVDASALGGSPTLGLTNTGGDSYEASFTVSNPTVSDGPVSLDVTATDAVGLTTTDSDVVTFDTTAPTLTNVEVTQTGGDADDVVKTGDTVSVAATVTDVDAGVASVTVDASALGGSSTLALVNTGGDSYEATFDVTNPPAADGDVSLSLSATDTVGSVATAADSVTLDTTAPTASTPTAVDAADGDEYVTAGDDVLMSGTATDALSGVESVTFEGSSLPLTKDDGENVYELTDSPFGNADGILQLSVAVVDVAGNSVAASDTVTVDNTAPDVSTVSVVNADGGEFVTEGDTVAVTATVTDWTPLDVTVDASALGGPAALTLTDGDGDDTFEAEFDVTAPTVDDGDVALDVTAVDSVALSTTSSDTVTLDTAAPTVSTVSVEPADGSAAAGDGETVAVSVTTTDAAGVGSVTVDASSLGGPATVALTDGDADDSYDGTFAVSSPTVGDGDVSLPITATDARGTGVTTVGTVTLDTSGPTFTGVTPTDRVRTKAPEVGVSVTDATAVDWSTLSVSIAREDGETTYLDGLGAKDTGVTVNTTTNNVTISPRDADVKFDEQPTRATVSVADVDGNPASVTWVFTVNIPEKNDKPPKPAPSIVVTVDGGLATVTTDQVDNTTDVRIQRATRGSTVNLTYNADDVANDTTRDGSALSQVSLSLNERTDFDFRVEYSPKTFDSTTSEPVENASLGYLRVDHADSDAVVDSASFTFSVDRDYVTERGLDPESLVLHRLVDGEWETYELALVDETADAYTVRATVPGLSMFVVGGAESPVTDDSTTETQTDTPTSEPTTTAVSETPTPEPGTTATTSPGFGLIAVLAALAVVALAAVRRGRHRG